MNIKKRGLNKGLDSLLGDLKSFREKNKDLAEVNDKAGDNFVEIKINNIKPNPNQPRRFFNQEQIDNLAKSIQSEGIIQPILVKKNDNFYEIIAGERRFRAANQIGLKTIPCVIKNISNQSASLISLIENLQREDLNEIEKAQSFNALIDEFGYTHEKLAEKLGQSRTAVTNTLRLLKLSDFVKNALVSKKIEMSQARALLSLDEKNQISLCQKIITEGLSTRAVEKLVYQSSEKNTQSKSEKKLKDKELLDLENEIANNLQTKVEINHLKSGKGNIKIHYHCVESLNGILKKINKN